MLRAIRTIERFVAAIAITAAWVTIFWMIGVRIFDIVARQFMTTPSALLSAMESGAFTLLVVLGFGYAYVRNAHVRVDVVRERCGPRAQAWIEIIGGVFALLPLCAAIIVFYAPFVEASYAVGERAWMFLGLRLAWLVKAMLPFGCALLALAGVAAIARNVLFLMGRLPAPVPGADGGTAPGGA